MALVEPNPAGGHASIRRLHLQADRLSQKGYHLVKKLSSQASVTVVGAHSNVLDKGKILPFPHSCEAQKILPVIPGSIQPVGRAAQQCLLLRVRSVLLQRKALFHQSVNLVKGSGIGFLYKHSNSP